jgi:NodT family efflux transporter outer membrane factor (OMF) lipoprotein
MRYSLLAILVACSGCLVGPDYDPPTVPAPTEWHQQLDEAYQTDQADVGAWWTLLNDPVLDTLIECSVDSNLDVYAALTRIWQARTQICIATSDGLGRIEGTGSFTRSLQSLNAIGAGGFGGGGAVSFLLEERNIYALGFNTAWEPDVWGRVFRRVEAAEANTGEFVEAFRDALVMLYGDIASTYIEIRTVQERLEYAKRNVQIQTRALELVKSRVEGGISPVLEEYQAESNLAATESVIPPLNSRLQRALNRLAVLAGEYPGTLHDCFSTVLPIPDVPAELPLVLPCNVIRQRPDIRQAERVLAARTAEVGVAISELYPRLRLGGTFGISSDGLTNLFDADSWGYSIGPSFIWPILNGGRIKCNIHATKFAVEEAVANYQQAVLRAMEEVENAIVTFNNEKTRKETLRRTVDSAERQLESVLELYRNDKTNFQNVLDSLRTLFNAQDALAESEGEVIQSLIVIYRALGGGWDVNAHCVDRRVRLRCPERADPSVVDVEPEGDAADQYFRRVDEDDEAIETNGLNNQLPADPDDLDLPDPDTAPDIDEDSFDVDRFFKDVLNKSKTDDVEPPADDGPAVETLPDPRSKTRDSNSESDSLLDALKKTNEALDEPPSPSASESSGGGEPPATLRFRLSD